MISNLFFLFIYIVEAFIAFMYFSDNYEKKLKPWISILICCALYFFAFIINIMGSNNVLINLFVFLVINIIYAMLSVNITFLSALFHSSILLALMFLTEAIVQAISSFILNIPLDAYRDSLSALILSLIHI